MSTRFTLSGPFERFLETLVIEEAPETDGELDLICDECGDRLCQVEDGDTLLVLIVTALAHDDQCPRSEGQDRRD